MRATVPLLSMLLLSVACGDDSAGTDTAVPETDAAIETEAVVFDIEIETTVQEIDNPSRDFGEPCLGNADCQSGWCVEGPEGYICTGECLETCPDAYDCKSVQNAKGDVTFLCLPRVLKLCVSCLEDSQCNGGTCLDIAGSKQCAAGCDEEDDCPDGYTCLGDATGEKTGSFCQPVSGTCDCSPPFEGVTRLCTNTNDLGTCRGAETCDPTVGWVECTALVPIPELCDFVDNDCDTEVDEDFKTDGVYATPNDCGSCGLKCADVLANADETECVVQSGSARCQVVNCAPGYTRLNPYVCAPEASSLCQPCTTAAECLGTEAACTELDDGKFCSLPCDQDADCAVGFTCEDGENGLQCVPEFGSCTCDGSNTNLARSCTKIFTPPDPNLPIVTCKGFEACTSTGWGGCDLPDDACDGIDNDCDGVVDGPHKTGDRYTTVENCGACGISCLAFVRPNAAPICDTAAVVPQCGYQCAGSAVDVNGLGDDGCECVPVPGADLAGDDIDSNCDGVDGEVNNAIFVSKDGLDGNPGTRDLPVLSIQVGIDRARDGNKRDVYVATGVYSQNILLVEGVGVFGGYSPSFDQHVVVLYETAIIGGTPDSGHPGTVSAFNIGSGQRDTVIDGFTIFGVNAGNIAGGNSYGVYVRNSTDRLRISNNRVFGSAGGNGESGQRGGNGLDGVDGVAGAAAKNLSIDCTAGNESNGGAGGVRACEDVVGANGVNGGNGGRAACPTFQVRPPDSSKGSLGSGNGVGVGGAVGWAFLICAVDAPPATCMNGITTYPYACETCNLPGGSPYNPTSGSDGTTGAGGQKGSAGGAAGTIADWQWMGATGGNGENGVSGSGGGGGGAAGGVEVTGTGCDAKASNDDIGGSGGGGGSGGCRGTGGFGGKAGGGSFGIFIVGSDNSKTPILKGNNVVSGRGGAGGSGGSGGVGGAGGAGGGGGAPGDQSAVTRCAAGGGNGGNGGGGGHGGGGGGGAGGPSYGIYVRFTTGNFTAPATWTNNTATHGLAGAGGLGGSSIDTTGSGVDGAAGTAADANY